MGRAADLRAWLVQKGHTVSVVPTPVSANDRWFRVVVGEFSDPEGAVRFWSSMKWGEQTFR
jgi:hypothetical protein